MLTMSRKSARYKGVWLALEENPDHDPTTRPFVLLTLHEERLSGTG